MTTLTMARVRPKLTPPDVKPSHPNPTPDYETDEALWAAYRRYDKSAVTAKITPSLSERGESRAPKEL